jgi:hypothetical protein
MTYSSPRYLGPECKSFRTKDFELNTLEGFINFFLLFLTGIMAFSESISPGRKDFGSNDCNSYLSMFFFAFLIFSAISSSSSPQRHVRQHHRQEDFLYFSWFIYLFVGIRFNL